jgi:tetratricopeptide (TPR) repeat protein
MATADVMYRAGSGDVTVVPDLARMAVDRSQGALLRASAADYISRLLLGGGPTGGAPQSQTSFGAGGSGGPPRPRERAAADPEGMVRATAIKALAATGQAEKVLPALTARLIDPSRVVRVRAAEGLLALGIVTLPGVAGQALARAQDEYLAGLGAFPDVASNHAAIGWLEASRGRVEQAQQALDTALKVEPSYPRPYVVKGIIEARAGRYQTAIELWRKAKELSPDDPTVDQLIAEAEKRKAGAR